MSGIVGGAGSKSGIIGQTELDYEEGVHACTSPTAVGSITLHSTIRDLYYTKIGKFVWIAGQIILTSAGTTAAIFYFDLPFVSDSSTGNRQSVVIDFYNNGVGPEKITSLINYNSSR